MPAVGIALGEYRLAINKSGKKITVSATTYKAKPKYCIPIEVSETAH